MIDLPVGTMVEVLRTKLVSQVCIVESSDPLILRPTTAWERVKYHFKRYRAQKGEYTAAVEALDVIEKAREKAKT